MNESYDVVVIGGGAAGLSGAIALARSRRSVLVVDAGDQRNASAPAVHNFLTRDGAPPAEILRLGRDEVTRYGGRVEAGRVTALRRDGGAFMVEIGERAVAARRLLIATGLRDELPDVPGLKARWGIDVLHCPYCHGWEIRDRRIGVLATGPLAAHQALLFRQLSPHVTLLQHTGPPLADEQRGQLRAVGVTIIEGAVAEVEADASGLTGIRLATGTRVPLDALIVAPLMVARAELLAQLGLDAADVRIGEHSSGVRSMRTRPARLPSPACGLRAMWAPCKPRSSHPQRQGWQPAQRSMRIWSQQVPAAPWTRSASQPLLTMRLPGPAVAELDRVATRS
jgi:thioredoxin reductase